MVQQHRFALFATIILISGALAGCSGKGSALSGAFNQQLKKNPPVVYLSLDMPSGATIYGPKGERSTDYFVALRQKDTASLDPWVKAGWLTEKTAKVLETQLQTDSFGTPDSSPRLRMALNSDPSYAKRVNRAVSTLRGMLPSIDAQMYFPDEQELYFEHAARNRRMVETPLNVPAGFFLVLPYEENPFFSLNKIHAALKSLVDGGYLTKRVERVWSIAPYQIPHFKYGATTGLYVKTISPRPQEGDPYFNRTKVVLYFITKKANGLLKRDGVIRGASDMRYNPPTLVLAKAEPRKAVGVNLVSYEIGSETHKGVNVFFKAAHKLTPLAGIRSVRALAGKRVRRQLAGAGNLVTMHTLFRGTSFDHVVPGGIGFSVFAIKPPEHLRLYTLTPTGKKNITISRYHSPYVDVGRWSGEKLLNYKIGKRKVLDATLAFARFHQKFKFRLSAPIIAMLKPFSHQKLPKEGEERTLGCVFQKHKKKWTVTGCGADAITAFNSIER